jgi:hypothetical protein
MNKAAAGSIHSLQLVPRMGFFDRRKSLPRRESVLNTKCSVSDAIPPALRFADIIRDLAGHGLLAQ